MGSLAAACRRRQVAGGVHARPGACLCGLAVPSVSPLLRSLFASPGGTMDDRPKQKDKHAAGRASAFQGGLGSRDPHAPLANTCTLCFATATTTALTGAAVSSRIPPGGDERPVTGGLQRDRRPRK